MRVFDLLVATLAVACAASKPPVEPPAAPPVTADDVRILERASALLADESRWNRADTRECPPGATRWSLFCALHDASIEVLGHYQHRRAALEEVRLVIEERTRGQEFAHRLMDFNNLPSTTLADLHAVLSAAKRRVAERLNRPAARPSD